jgi:oxygen-dependent protoporphyrinogen oxidase
MTVDVAIIGGGVSGLATAHALVRQGHRVVVLERQVRAGGNAVSEHIGGFLMEHGPSSVNAAVPAASAVSRAMDLEALCSELGPGVRYRYLLGENRLHRISPHPLGFVASDYLSLPARLRLLAEVLVPRGPAADEETVAQFCARRFGAEFAERVIDPLVGGLLAGRAAGLSMRAVFPALLDLERRYGSIARGVLRRRLLGGGKMPGRRLFSWRDGIGTLPKALARRLGPAIKTGVAVRRIRPTPFGFRIDAGSAGAIEARSVVLATQPHVAASLLEAVDEAGAAAAAEIDAPPLAVVFLGYRRQQVAHPLDGLGYLTPEREQRALSGGLFCSTMFAGRAPEGHVALAGYIGGDRAPDLALLPAADLVDLTRSEFHDLLGARGEPVVARVRQWPRGLPQYRLGHGGRVAALREAEGRRPGLFVTGNYFAGPGIATCLAQAEETAARVQVHLAGAEKYHPALRDLEAEPISLEA